MALDLWGEKVPHHRIRRKVTPVSTASPTSFSITGNDCEIFGHTLREWDLGGCSSCLDCKVNIFCPRCIAHHPQDETAIPILCERHQESAVSA